MNSKKLVLLLASSLCIFSFTVVVVANNGNFSFARSDISETGSIEFTNNSNLKQLDTNKYSIRGTTTNGTSLYMISQSESDIKGTNYVGTFSSASDSFYLSFAYDENGHSPLKFQAVDRISLTTGESDERTYNIYYNSTDGVNFTDDYYTLTTSSEVGSYTFSSPVNFLKVVLATAGVSNVTKVKIDFTCSYNPSDIIATQVDKQNAIREVTEAYDKLDLDEYATNKRAQLIDKLNTTLETINNAVYLSDVQSAVNSCISFFNNAPRAKDVTKGTWFDKKSSDGKYEFDRDEDNNLVISYNGYPGHWVYVGTSSLVTDVAINNFARIRFSNDSDNQIQVCLQLTGANSYKVDSHVMNIAAREIKTVELDYSDNVTNFYFFLDSCSEHDRSGQVTILETSLGYKEVDIPFSKTVQINKSMSVGDGSLTGYDLTEEDYPKFITRVDALFQVDFKGNGSGGRWFGVHVYSGSKHITLKESQVHTQDITIDGVKDGGINAWANMPIESGSKLSVGSKIYMDVSYAADTAHGYNDLEFKVLSYTFYYGSWAEEVNETVEVNTQVYINGAGKDGDGNYYAATIPYSSFSKTGKVIKMDVNFTTLNNQSYGKSQLKFDNFDFTSFSTGNNSVLNVGSKMDTTKSGNPVEGTMTLYPTSDIDLTADKNISIYCWWASATNITINSVTMYTESLEVPSAVTNLEAHPIDQGVVLTWTRSKVASSYEVYVNGVINKDVTTTYATIDGLNNNQEYEFKVVAKNAAGVSDGVTAHGTPVEGGTYDTFIEGLNNDLEVMIGESGIASFLNGGDAYKNDANNFRLKRTINKMLDGEETTIAYMGGSITVGEQATIKDENHHQEGYAYYSYQWLKRNYDVQNKSHFVNGSISGTGSEIGLVRSQKDILNHNPDLVFIEFAANNGSTNFDKQSYESLIRRCMALPNDPAIVLVFSCTTYTGSGCEFTYMNQIGKYYKLPMFSMQQAMATIVSVFDKAKTDPIFAAFTKDGTHPNDNGHQLMAKGLCYTLRNQINRATDEINTYPSSPSNVGYDKFQNLISVDNTNSGGLITSLGSFATANTATPSTSQQSDVTAFQQGWKKTDTSVNEPMVIDVTAKNFILIYEAGNKSVASDPTGNIVVTYVNKADPTDTLQLSWNVAKTCKQNTNDLSVIEERDNGWENPCAILLFDKTVAAEYTITIQMQDVTGICTIMAFGYTA